ncbi:YesL family protein [Sporosarcina sp. FSL K6-5500]|uniref:YesL family protein n=1 Tax=Sporosarcina sp. FSL K6-5500 TaxID=2921558 RepID=UPI0030F60DB4
MKSLNGIFKAIFEIGKWLSKMMYLHLLWVIFSLMGLVVFGVMPATTAMFTVIRKWMEDDNDIPVFQTFLASYKTHFLKSNALGTFLVAIGIFLYIDMKISKQLVQSFYLHIILLIIGFLYLITLLYFFPVFVRYKLKYSQNFKQSFYIALARPGVSIFMCK